MAREILFKKFSGERIANVEEYVKNYVDENSGIEVMVGTDSQNRGKRTFYSTVIAMYRVDKQGVGHGAHCIFKKWSTERSEYPLDRLLVEVENSIKVADELKSAGIKIKYVDIDLNPNPDFESNKLYSAAKGWVTGSGYKCRWKTLGPLITTMADWVVKH